MVTFLNSRMITFKYSIQILQMRTVPTESEGFWESINLWIDLFLFISENVDSLPSNPMRCFDSSSIFFPILKTHQDYHTKHFRWIVFFHSLSTISVIWWLTKKNKVRGDSLVLKLITDCWRIRGKFEKKVQGPHITGKVSA